MSSYTSPKRLNEIDLDCDKDSGDGVKNIDKNGSDEDTEDASECEVPTKQAKEYTEIKEQMYQDKLAFFKKQLQQLNDRTLPEYLKRYKKIEQYYRERLRLNEHWKEYELQCVERDYIQEKKDSVKEFEEKKIDLKENLIIELEEKKKAIEAEQQITELTGDPMEVKTAITRKLRRRPNDPIPMPEKRRKASPAQLNIFLDEYEIMEDLRMINKVSGKPICRSKPTPTTPTVIDTLYDAKIEEDKLYYDKRWFQRGQAVFVECKELGKVSGMISAVGPQEVYIRKTTDNAKIRIFLSQLQKGKYILRRRSS